MIQYAKHMMKSFHIASMALLLIALLFALTIANLAQPVSPAQNSAAAALAIQITPIPPTQDQSVVGSTDGIMVMGFFIVIIVALPLLLRKKRK